jgi:hypothetical protein
VIGVQSIFKLTRKVAGLVRMMPTFTFRVVENAGSMYPFNCVSVSQGAFAKVLFIINQENES